MSIAVVSIPSTLIFLKFIFPAGLRRRELTQRAALVETAADENQCCVEDRASLRSCDRRNAFGNAGDDVIAQLAWHALNPTIEAIPERKSIGSRGRPRDRAQGGNVELPRSGPATSRAHETQLQATTARHAAEANEHDFSADVMARMVFILHHHAPENLFRLTEPD